MLDRNIFFNITSNSYSQFLNCPKDSSLESPFRADHLEHAISIHYMTAFKQRKKQNWVQLITFHGLGLLFALCAILIYWKSPNFNCGVYFNKCEAVKNSVDFLCLALSLGSFGMGSVIRPEKEALNYLGKRIQEELRDQSCHVQIKLESLFSHKINESEPMTLLENKLAR